MDITRLLTRWSGGDANAFGELMPHVYAEMRKLADHYMRQERPDHTLQPTALVHEAFLRLAETRRSAFENRVHFYGAAAQAMRRVLVDYARSHRSQKRGDGIPAVDLDQAAEVGIDLRLDLVALDEALDALAAVAPRPAKVVELRYLRRPLHRRDRRVPQDRACHRQAPLGVRARLALSGVERRLNLFITVIGTSRALRRRTRRPPG